MPNNASDPLFQNGSRENLSSVANHYSDWPPLSIRHFLYWMAGVAISVWLHYGGDPPSPKNFAGVLLVSSGIAYCIAAGGGIAFVAWTACRRLLGRRVTFNSPGAKYATLIGLMMTISLLNAFGEKQLEYIAESNPDAWFQVCCTSNLIQDALLVVISIFGLVWIGGIAWRVAMIAITLRNAIGAYDSLSLLDLVPSTSGLPVNVSSGLEWLNFSLPFVPITAVLASLIHEHRKAIPRDWPHYFGALLCGILAIEFLLVQVALAVLVANRG